MIVIKRIGTERYNGYEIKYILPSSLSPSKAGCRVGVTPPKEALEIKGEVW